MTWSEAWKEQKEHFVSLGKALAFAIIGTTLIFIVGNFIVDLSIFMYGESIESFRSLSPFLGLIGIAIIFMLFYPSIFHLFENLRGGNLNE